MRPSRDPSSRYTDKRVTYALKILMIVALALYLCEAAFGAIERLRAVIYV